MSLCLKNISNNSQIFFDKSSEKLAFGTIFAERELSSIKDIYIYYVSRFFVRVHEIFYRNIIAATLFSDNAAVFVFCPKLKNRT